MKVLNANVEWMKGWGNSPRLQVLVDAVPDHSLLLYEHQGGAYFAEYEGFVSFFYYTEPGQGYGGRHFHIVLIDGSKVVLKGPWSSRAGAIMQAGFTPCLDVSITAEQKVFDRGYTYFAGSITLELAKQAVASYCPGVWLWAEDHGGETVWIPRWKNNPCGRCKGFGKYTKLFGKGGEDVECIKCEGTGGIS